MKINFDLKFYKIVSIILSLISLALILYMFKSNSEGNVISQKEFYEKTSSISNVNEAKENEIKVEYAWEKHKLEACAGPSASESEVEFASSSPEINGYKVLLDCSKETYNQGPGKKDESFYILDIKNNIKYYIYNEVKYLVGSPVILGVQDKNIFISYCYESCGRKQMLSLGESSERNENVRSVFPYHIGEILDRNKIYSHDLFVLNNKVVVVYENKIYEFNSNNFTLKVLKEIDADKVFGRYGGMGGEFYADYKIDGNFIKYNIYKKDEVIDDKDGKPVNVGTFEVR